MLNEHSVYMNVQMEEDFITKERNKKNVQYFLLIKNKIVKNQPIKPMLI